MKTERHARILEIINSMDIETQEELAKQLKLKGIDVKQSTLSRDIKELRLTKVLSDNKKYKYASISHKNNVKSDKLIKIFAQTVVNVEKVNNFIVIKTMSGSASAAAEVLDSLNLEGMAGCIAGDNTIFVLMRNDEQAQIMVSKIIKLMND
ncbi:arginine repressor [Clostridium tepidiprofundi DSM 19306]|uniref:Arginine repressor n=1 Tax=Clostridium tepidiprofundi DSM 19306 TaxID=1121338 RepID=A0A151B7C1_9CLOT|nr:arginine repressor [Clostridium tepidiprofundi]KYH35703.1 arginine repressor [Clostridium tepidiprofundi DSM 19306]